MPGSLTPIVRWVILDANGAPVPGAKLWTYESNTSTPQDTFSDAALTTPHTNPVVALADGVLPAIFLGPNAYRFLVTDANDVTIYPAEDDIINLQATNIVNADISASAAIDWSKISKVGSSLADLTTRSAAALSSGELANGRVAEGNVTQHQAALAIATSQLTGDMPDARIVASNVTQHEAALSIAGAQVDSGTIAQARLGNVLGAWGTVAVDTVVQAATDLLVGLSPDLSTDFTLLTDAANPPTTSRGFAKGSEGTTPYVPVRKGDFYKVTFSGGGGGTIHTMAIGT